MYHGRESVNPRLPQTLFSTFASSESSNFGGYNQKCLLVDMMLAQSWVI
jgi:hypothetical protein